jgi:hypothetical protein
MSNEQIVARLQRAITEWPGRSGPVTWTVEDHGNKVLLVGTYDADTETDDGKPLTDEPWKIYGGDAILEAAGLEWHGSGIYAYQDRWGDPVVAQCVEVAEAA